MTNCLLCFRSDRVKKKKKHKAMIFPHFFGCEMHCNRQCYSWISSSTYMWTKKKTNWIGCVRFIQESSFTDYRYHRTNIHFERIKRMLWEDDDSWAKNSSNRIHNTENSLQCILVSFEHVCVWCVLLSHLNSYHAWNVVNKSILFGLKIIMHFRLKHTAECVAMGKKFVLKWMLHQFSVMICYVDKPMLIV